MNRFIYALEKHNYAQYLNVCNRIQTFTYFFYGFIGYTYPHPVGRFILYLFNIDYILRFLSWLLPNIFQPDRGGALIEVWDEYITQSDLDQCYHPWTWRGRVNNPHSFHNQNNLPCSRKWRNQYQDTLQGYIILNSLVWSQLDTCIQVIYTNQWYVLSMYLCLLFNLVQKET